MSVPRNPFAKSSSSPGIGNVVLSLLPPGKQVLTTFTYQYPLKLIAPDPHDSATGKHVTTVFLLTYGGGLIGGDAIHLHVDVGAHTRLVLLTQGSTKIFKSATPSIVTRQVLDVSIWPGASLCYLPDPTQPYGESVYDQRQTFTVDAAGTSNLLLLDWVSEGRRARGESWTLWGWKGRNEVREYAEEGKGRLLIRDAMALHAGELGSTLAQKTNGLGILGTLVIYGSMFTHLGEFFMQEFAAQPRLGAKSWADDRAPNTTTKSDAELALEARRAQEQRDGLLWTAAQIRGFVLVKFGAKELDGARQWLGGMLKREGTVEREFGHQALLSLR